MENAASDYDNDRLAQIKAQVAACCHAKWLKGPYTLPGRPTWPLTGNTPVSRGGWTPIGSPRFTLETSPPHDRSTGVSLVPVLPLLEYPGELDWYRMVQDVDLTLWVKILAKLLNFHYNQQLPVVFL